MSDRKCLEKASAIFLAFRAIDTEMTLQLAYTFVLCALNEGANIGDITRLMGTSPSTTSRHILDLGQFSRSKKPGHGLVETRIDPNSLRRKTVHLTPKGRNLVNQIVTTAKL